MEVFNVYRGRMAETIYQAALACEMSDRSIPFEREKQCSVFYKHHKLDINYRPDFLCYGNIIVELKSPDEILKEHRFQVFNYMRLLKTPVGLLVNFGENSLHVERYLFDEEHNNCCIVDASLSPVYRN